MLEAKDFTGLTLADQSFHRQMYEAAQVPDLWPLVRRQSGHPQRRRRLHLPIAGEANAVVENHASIVNAIATGNPEQAQDVCESTFRGRFRISQKSALAFKAIYELEARSFCSGRCVRHKPNARRFAIACA